MTFLGVVFMRVFAFTLCFMMVFVPSFLWGFWNYPLFYEGFAYPHFYEGSGFTFIFMRVLELPSVLWGFWIYPLFYDGFRLPSFLWWFLAYPHFYDGFLLTVIFMKVFCYTFISIMVYYTITNPRGLL